MNHTRESTSTISPFDLHLMAEGTHYRSFEKLGAHTAEVDGVAGVHFAVWAPNARHVDVIGRFNLWRAGATPLRVRWFWRAVLNSDAAEYGGSGLGNAGGASAVHESHHGRPYRLDLVAPPLGVVILRSAGAHTS